MNMKQEAQAISTFDYTSTAVLILVIAIIFIVISLIRYKVKKKKPMVLLVISGVFVLATIVFFILGHFLNTETEVDLEKVKENSQIAQNIQNNKVDHVLEDIDKLYPENDVKDAMDRYNRYNLIWNYYMQIGDDNNIKKASDNLNKVVSENAEVFEDEINKANIEETNEYFRILDNIQKNNLSNVLKDIDKLYPSEDSETDYKTGERFELLWNYYKKINDTQKIKQMLEDGAQQASLKNEIRVKRILEEESKSK